MDSLVRLRLPALSLAAILVFQAGCWQQPKPQPVVKPVELDPQQQKIARILASREKLDETVWAGEKLAERYEARLVKLWDDLLAARGKDERAKLQVLKDLPLRTIRLGNLGEPTELDHGIRRHTLARATVLDRNEWHALLDQWFEQGYRMEQSEWHHAEFNVGDEGAASTVSMALHLLGPNQRRVIVRGTIQVLWAQTAHTGGPESKAPLPEPEHVELADVEVLLRDGPPMFREVKTIRIDNPTDTQGMHPVIVYDLDSDGLCEIVLSGRNHRYRNLGGMKFEQQPFVQLPPQQSKAGMLADLTGDGNVDYATVVAQVGFVVYAGTETGTFPGPPTPACPGLVFQNPQVMTAGDVDGDGDLDVWISQHKAAYLFGQMPTPYYDANDGFPAYFLINDGQGRFHEATEQAGLATKRFRRTYGASFVDLDGDLDLDLMVVSDFSGIDLYLNDGQGRFRDATEELVDEWHNFGMSSTFGDYNGDGQLDFFISGMGSTTARRLEHMGLGRSDFTELDRMRPVMGYGSRMYLAGPVQAGPVQERTPHRYRQPSFAGQVNRTGWTWGATTWDFDNDGDHDLYLANGHSSGSSTRDHCWHFWCHDIYTNSSQTDPARYEVFKKVLAGYESGADSWDGYQKNVCLMNLDGQGFVNVAFLLGLAAEYDARAVIGDDLDNDGRVDLIVSEQSIPNRTEALHVYHNQSNADGAWVGVQLFEQPNRSALGAVVRVVTDSGTQVKVVVAGDSYNAQHPARVHFGLGSNDRVRELNVTWPDGENAGLVAPKLNYFYPLRAE